MFHHTWIRFTLAVALLLAVDALLLGWLFNGWLDVKTQDDAVREQVSQAMALTLCANFALLGVSVALLAHRYIGVPLHNLRLSLRIRLNAFRETGDDRYAGLIVVTRQPSDLNEIGLQVNALMQQSYGNPYRTSATSEESEALQGHRSLRPYAD